MSMHKVLRRTAPARPLPDALGRQMAEAFGKLLVDLRFRRKVARKHVASQIGMDWHRLRNLEEGMRTPAIDEVAKLAGFYGVDPAEVFAATLQGADRLMAGVVSNEALRCHPVRNLGRAARS